jgi:hypothetical protein
MQARDLFGVVIRTLGVFSFIYALYDLFYLVTDLLGVEHKEYHDPAAVLATAIFFLLVGTALIGGAEPIVRLAYRKP